MSDAFHARETLEFRETTLPYFTLLRMHEFCIRCLQVCEIFFLLTCLAFAVSQFFFCLCVSPDQHSPKLLELCCEFFYKLASSPLTSGPFLNYMAAHHIHFFVRILLRFGSSTSSRSTANLPGLAFRTLLPMAESLSASMTSMRIDETSKNAWRCRIQGRFMHMITLVDRHTVQTSHAGYIGHTAHTESPF